MYRQLFLKSTIQRKCNLFSINKAVASHTTLLKTKGVSGLSNLRTVSTLAQNNLQVENEFLETSQGDVSEYIKKPSENMVEFSEEEKQMFLDPDNNFNYRSLAIIHACLKMGDPDRAYVNLLNFRRNRPTSFNALIDIHVHNSFIDSYIMKGGSSSTSKALQYYGKLKEFGVEPNVTTFALIFKGYIRNKQLSTMKVFYKEMIRNGYSIEDIKLSSHLSSEEIDVFLKTVDYQKYSETLPSVEEVLDQQVDKTKLENPDTIEKEDLLTTNVLGVNMLKSSLKSAEKGSLTLHERQIQLERAAIESAIEKMKIEAKGRGDKLLEMNMTPMRKYMIEWKTKLTDLILKYQKKVKKVDTDPKDAINHYVYGPFFCVLSAEKMATLAIQNILRICASKDAEEVSSITFVAACIGKSIEQEYHAEQMADKNNKYLLEHQGDLEKLYMSGKLFNMAMRRIHAKVVREKITSSWITKWPGTAQIKVGADILEMFLECATITPPGQTLSTPAFSHSYQSVKGNVTGIVMCDPYILELLSSEPSPSAYGPRFLPMLVPPKPWLTYNSGGFLTMSSKCMRCKDGYEQKTYLEKADESGQLDTVLSSLDILGSVKWKVNKTVLNVITKVWNSGERFADIPPAHTKVIPPTKPEDFDENLDARRKYLSKIREQDLLVRNNHSLRCDVNYKVEIATAFKEQEFYFPHNLDFRGRAYPIPPLFNHLGNDLCRGLLTFAEAKPLGERGLNWLKVHLSTLYGYDKYSFADRIKFADDNIESILDSADNPLDGNKWWAKAEDPWQCLAACFELTNAIRSGNPHSYPCALPIHQDGTCNGLQHYAALGGDIEGAKHVNLCDSEKPQDIYSGVLELVLERIEQDVKDDVPEAKSLQGWVKRKVIKQTVMTNVYGVTFIGARNQILSQLKDISSLHGLELNKLSYYLTKLVFSSLGQIFSSAQALQSWLNECAGRIASSVPAEVLINQKKSTKTKAGGKKKAKSTSEIVDKESSNSAIKSTSLASVETIRSKQMTSVVWTTPLGLTIVQPYRKSPGREVATNLQAILIQETDNATPVNSRKQRTAFPPNFIHSLDASHMMLTALAMQKLNLDFASVHDSYWTHACDVDAMNVQIRKQFIYLHSQPLLENLLEEFKIRYKGYKHRTVADNPAKDTPKRDLIADLSHELSGEESTTSTISTFDTVKKTSKTIAWTDLEFPPLPQRGTFDINEVAKSTYFFH